MICVVHDAYMNVAFQRTSSIHIICICRQAACVRSRGHHPLCRWPPVCDVFVSTFCCTHLVSLWAPQCGTSPCHPCWWHCWCACPPHNIALERRYDDHLLQDQWLSACSSGCKSCAPRHSRRCGRVSSPTCGKSLQQESDRCCKSAGNCCSFQLQVQVPKVAPNSSFESLTIE